MSDGTRQAPPRLVVGSLPRSRQHERSVSVDGSGGNDEADPARAPMLLAQQGDPLAFRSLVEMFQDRVMRVMVSVLRCDRAIAEDLTQEVFLRVHKGLPGFDGQVRFAAWLHTISMNVAISEYRRRRTLKRNKHTLSLNAPLPGSEDLYADPAGHERDPADNVHQREFLQRVREAVSELPDDFREAVVLRDMEALSYEEIAVALDLPIGTVRSRIHRGRLLLQVKLREFQP